MTLTADSVKITNCDSAELIIENHTQDVPGFLFNSGRGRTIFKRPLTKVNDNLYLVGADSLQIPGNAWVQSGNAFGVTGILGTKDNHHLDLYTNNTRRARLDSLGNLLLGPTTYGGYKLDVSGSGRFSNTVNVSVGDTYDVGLRPTAGNIFAGSVDGSVITFGNIYGYIGINKQTSGMIPQNSMVIGGVSPNKITAIIDYLQNPVFIVNGVGTASINGGYSGIAYGVANSANQTALQFNINSARGTGNGTPGDIAFNTGNSQASGTTIHSMTNRWWIKGGTGNLTNTVNGTSAVDITGTTGYSQLGLRTSYTPTSSADANGNTGDFSWDGNYFYIKTPAGWKRSALTSF